MVGMADEDRAAAGFSPRRREVVLLIATLLLFGAMAGAAAGPWRASPANTRGWELMTPEERIQHQARVRGFTGYADCEAYRVQHHALMVERARQRDLTLPEDRRDFCDRLKPRQNPQPGAG